MPSTRHLSLLFPLLLVPALSGCTGAILGNVFVVFLTVGIFFGTLGLGRSSSASSSRASSSRADGSAQE
jgi:hypothetical protein